MSKSEIVRVRTAALTNELHFRFHIENDALYKRYGEEPLGIATIIVPFRSSLADLGTALERIVKSADTDRIAVADHKFDTSFSGMSAYVYSCLNHFDPAVKHAAENLEVVLRHYGNIGKEAYRQELASSFNLLQDLRVRSADVTTLTLEPWMQAHEQAAAALAALLDERTGESAQQTELRVGRVRREVDTGYQNITDRIEAMINLHGTDFVAGFRAEYNAHATEYKNKLAQHLGRIHANKNKKKNKAGSPNATATESKSSSETENKTATENKSSSANAAATASENKNSCANAAAAANEPENKTAGETSTN
ncbi:MAG: DUF6261 family protein [Prevotellaceae bacterium]|jgi:hypothetical protein|nr:DUF6261 family protein [Prevotellaceae bacterium]